MKKLYLFLLPLICYAFSLQALEGSFQEITGSPFPAGSGPGSFAYSPLVSNNLFAAIPNYNDNPGDASVYQVNQTTGAFTPVPGSPFLTGPSPAWLAYSPIVSGNLFAAVVNYGNNTLSVYQVDQTTGAFTLVDSPTTGEGPYAGV